MENNKDTAKQQNNQPNIEDHSENKDFEGFISQGLKSGGVHIVANKSHGKSRLMFLVFSRLQRQQDVRCIAFDGSETWLYCASKVPTFTVQDRDIVAQTVKTTQDMESYQLTNWNLVKLALETHKDLLFRLKTRKPSKRGFLVRIVVNYLDSLQRAEKAQALNHENSKSIAYFIEEAQDCFSNRSSARLDMEEFLCTFNEARNNKEAFYTASQRLTDFSKTIRSKQLPCIGKLSSEDITPNLRRIEKAHNLDFANMKPKTWYFEGSTIQSPEFKQSGKPFIVNKAIKAQYLANLKPQSQPKKSFIEKWILPLMFPQTQRIYKLQKQQLTIKQSQPLDSQEDEEEDEEMDDMFLLDPLSEEDP
jgi:hypothetical protein